MKSPRSCHLSVPPKASPGPFLVPTPCDDLREYRRDPATRQSPEVGIYASLRVRTALRLRQNRQRGRISGGRRGVAGVAGGRIGRSAGACRRVRGRRGGPRPGGGGGRRGPRARGGPRPPPGPPPRRPAPRGGGGPGGSAPAPRPPP